MLRRTVITGETLDSIRHNGEVLLRTNPNYTELADALQHEPTIQLLRSLFDPSESRTKLTLIRMYIMIHDTLETHGTEPTPDVIVGIMHKILTDKCARHAAVQALDVGPIRTSTLPSTNNLNSLK